MKYKFWVNSSRGFHRTGTVELPDNMTQEAIRDELENWCKNIFSMWHYTDALVEYGYEELLTAPPME